MLTYPQVERLVRLLGKKRLLQECFEFYADLFFSRFGIDRVVYARKSEKRGKFVTVFGRGEEVPLLGTEFQLEITVRKGVLKEIPTPGIGPDAYYLVKESRMNGLLALDVTREARVFTPDEQKEIIQIISLFSRTYNELIRVGKERRATKVDGLTGLRLRRGFPGALRQAILKVAKNTNSACLLLLDLDCFKWVNDNHGHLAGDEVLRRFGAIVKEVLADYPGSVAYRYGGEEFAIPVNGDIVVAEKIVAEIRKRLAGEVFTFPGGSFGMTFSAGLTEITSDLFQEFEPTDEDPDPSSLVFYLTDKALYKAKKDGRNCTVIA